MKEVGTESRPLKDLRHRAEALLREKPQVLSHIPPEEIQNLIQELLVHQIELEMQNEELRRTQLQLAEDTLMEDKLTIQALIDASPESALLINAKSNVLAINETAAQRLGKSKEGIIDRSIYDYLPPEVSQLRSAKLKQVFATGKQVCFCDEREGRHFYNSLYPVFNTKGDVEKIAIFAQDLTMQHQTELALRENEEKYRQLFENESDAVMVFDAETGRFEDANQATLDLYGYSKEEFLTLTVADVSAEKEKTRVAVKQVNLEELDCKYVPLRYFRRKDGSVFPGEINAGNFISGGRKLIIGAVRDITERVNAQEDLRKSEVTLSCAL